MSYMQNDSLETRIARLKEALDRADAVVVGAGAGMSASAGCEYSGQWFEQRFGDFIAKYGLTDLYTASFFNFPTEMEYWAFWSRMVHYERYTMPPKAEVYTRLRNLLDGKEYFVITTNVDHLFQRTGFDKQRLFYTQGDYGLLQCCTPCHQKTYDNEEMVETMFRSQEGMRVPVELIPRCPVCGEKMEVNLRKDSRFVQDEGWYEAAERYNRFLDIHAKGRTVYLDLGSGANTPVIFKYPFMQMAYRNPEATYISINLGQAYAPEEIVDRSICINEDIGSVLKKL